MNKKLIIIFLFAFTLRLSLVFIAHHGDLNNNITWGTLAVERGLNGFYEGEDWPYSAPNQPPLTILTFAGVRVIWQAIENASWWLNNNLTYFYSPFIWFWEGKGMTLLVKLPAILADMGIGFLIFKYFSKKKKKFALPVTVIWLFNPITWYNSSIWGQTDSVVNFLGLVAVFFLLKKRLELFFVVFTLSLLFKGSLSIFIPILLIIALWQKHKAGVWLKALFSSLLTTFLVSIWFHPRLDFFDWLFSLYNRRIFPGEIGYLTANAFNFWWLVDAGKTLDSIAYFGLPARVWGFLIAFGGIAIIGYCLSKKKMSEERIFLSLAAVSLITFLFMTRIHERYLYPFFPPATILLGLIPGLVLPYTIFLILHLLNLYHLFWAPSFAPLEALYRTSWFTQAISIFNILIFFSFLRLSKKARI